MCVWMQGEQRENTYLAGERASHSGISHSSFKKVPCVFEVGAFVCEHINLGGHVDRTSNAAFGVPVDL